MFLSSVFICCAVVQSFAVDFEFPLTVVCCHVLQVMDRTPDFRGFAPNDLNSLLLGAQPFCASSTEDTLLPSSSVQMPPVSHSSQNDIGSMVCFRCAGSSKTYKGLRGLKQHYSHSHKEFLSDFDNPHNFQPANSQQATQSVLTSSSKESVA